MRTNVGASERIVRLFAGGIMLFVASGWFRGRMAHRLAQAAGLELLATAVVGWCPENAILGRDTTQTRPAEREDALAR